MTESFLQAKGSAPPSWREFRGAGLATILRARPGLLAVLTMAKLVGGNKLFACGSSIRDERLLFCGEAGSLAALIPVCETRFQP